MQRGEDHDQKPMKIIHVSSEGGGGGGGEGAIEFLK